jgi:hypothetical protein
MFPDPSDYDYDGPDPVCPPLPPPEPELAPLPWTEVVVAVGLFLTFGGAVCFWASVCAG